MVAVKTVLYLTLVSGTTIAFLSSHWMLAWIGLEINAFAFIPLISQQNHPRATEAASKYFIIQASASGVLLFSSLLSAWLVGEWEISRMNTIAATLMMLSLAMKMGVAPFHFWPPEVAQGMNLNTALILATWQKLATLALLMQITNAINPFLLTTLAIASSAFASWAGMNQTQLRKILAYSSTAHLGWILLIMKYQPNLSLMALMIYILNSMAAFLILKESPTTKMSAITLLWSKSPMLTIAMILALFSLAGLPPLTGFMPKWLILDGLTSQQLVIPAILILMTALISLLFYTRICYFTIITLFPNPIKSKLSWRRKTKINKIILATVTMMTLLLLPTTPLFWTITFYFNLGT
uniref:NADH-ubiquinone oxidoreductase chain 2 n=1 Tax=Bario sanctaefilomenae TaxID=272069 RepID=A0A8F0WEL4_9TELE|nr:NADH dehydrogenase subunit 2 [Moenkhausia sanctaefilomenae]QWM92547.1 NADH dehydrogenase subunit 2 [Moenkhausia sanctaefilomenae]